MTQDIDVGKLAEQINDKADRDLWNTVPNVWNNTLNTSQITNCITEIPQDIKLELKDGVLTLKAGSKVYVPNGKNADGSNKFDVVVLEQDIYYSSLSHVSTVNRFVFVTPSRSILNGYVGVDVSSGTTPPSSEHISLIWYDTANNIIKFSNDAGVTWNGDGYSLPICIGNYVKDSGFISIDQVFNGFGYIGSTAFALPGVKGLIPNGRNEDGSLKNVEIELDTVITGSRNLTNKNIPIWLKTNKTLAFSNGISYDEKTNLIVGTTEKFVQIGICDMSSGVISNFIPKAAFHVVDYSDYAREIDRCAKLDKDNTFTGSNTFTDIINAKRVASLTGAGFGDLWTGTDDGNYFYSQIRASNKNGVFSFMGIGVNSDGNIDTHAPTPPTADNSTQIATTAWVNTCMNNKFQVVSTLPASPVTGTFYYIPE